MSMTRAEAIERLERLIALYEMASTENKMIDYSGMIDALKFSLSALHPVSREQVEKMRGEWEAVPRIGAYDMACSKCGYAPGIRFFSSDFCPNCGAPMTDEAVDMMLERLRVFLNDN